MKSLLTTLLLIFLLKTNAQIHVKSFLASEKSGLVGNYLLVDHNEALLVDAPMFKPDALSLIDTIKKIGVKLTTLFITHAHPDHYIGVSEIKAAFPEVHVVAQQEVAHEIAVNGRAIYDKIQKQFGENMPAPLIIPDSINTSTIRVGRTKLQILTFRDSEIDITTALWNKRQKQLFTADLVFNKVHLYMSSKRQNNWITQLNELEKLGAVNVFTGHGGEANAEAIVQSRKYIEFFQKTLEETKDEQEITNRINAAFPGLRMPGYLKFSLKAYLPKPKV